MKAYLAGAIEKAPDGGKTWREEIGIFLKEKLNHNFYNPAISEYSSLTVEEKKNFRKWKTSDTERFKKTVRKIIQFDINVLLNEVDYVICLWDQHTTIGGGTHRELTVAFLNNIPVYLVCGIDLNEISGWIVGCTEKIFFNFDELKKFLLEKYKFGVR